MNAREAAYLALLSAMQGEDFIADKLNQWALQYHPDERDFGLALEIASGSCRRGLTLDEIGRQLTPKGSLKLKMKERALLRTALYQRYFMNRVPLHAIVNETVALAKKAGLEGKSPFFNALLRASETSTPAIPENRWELFYSFPQVLIDCFVKAHGSAQTKELLTLFNQNFPPMARKRGTLEYQALNSPEEVKQAAHSKEFYIQNPTPGLLMEALQDKTPQRVLDLCASPGGKLLLAHDLFPQAELFANDVSDKKLQSIRDNLSKYGLTAHLRVGKGEEYPLDQHFDLILIDAPCSNTGVLHKRAEARYRFQPGQFRALQLALIQRAKQLLAPGGAIWYLTCSILPEENELLVQEACGTFQLQLEKDQLILPDSSGKDGGYGARLV